MPLDDLDFPPPFRAWPPETLPDMFCGNMKQRGRIHAKSSMHSSLLLHLDNWHRCHQTRQHHTPVHCHQLQKQCRQCSLLYCPANHPNRSLHRSTLGRDQLTLHPTQLPNRTSGLHRNSMRRLACLQDKSTKMMLTAMLNSVQE